MPFARDTLTELREQTAADINATLPGVDALLRFSNIGIIGDVVSGLADGHYGYLDWIALQSVPFTATGEYLEGWAALRDVFRKGAAYASGRVRFAATDGAVIPTGTQVNRTDGVTYVTRAKVTASGGAAIVDVLALVGGVEGNAAAGTAMTLAAAISGVTAFGSASTAIAGGIAIELDADLRTRMLAAYATPPQGGSITDYPTWALAVPGVTRCWVSPSAMGPGTMVLLFMMDNAQADHGGFPQGTNGCSAYEVRDTAAVGDQLTLANAIFAKQPAHVLVYAVAPEPNALTVTLSGLGGASDDTKSAIAAAITGALLINAVPGGVTNVLTIEAAIAAVPAAAGSVLVSIAAARGTVSDGGRGNILSNAGALPVLASVVYT